MILSSLLFLNILTLNISNPTIDTCITSLEQKEGLRCREISFKSDHYEIFLTYFDEVSIPEARQLIFEAVEKVALLGDPNSEIDLYLSFRKSDGNLLEPEKLCNCSTSQGSISYFSRLYGNGRLLLQETITEAQANLATNE